jgi:dihydroflavonol-4-reductase
MSSNRVTLVTGATGLVGNNVVRLLLSRGEAVRVLARGTTDRRPLAGLNVDVYAGDVRDEAAVRQACRGTTTVIHCAAHVNVGWAQPELYEEINVGGTRNVAIACREFAARMIHISSTDVFGRCSLKHPTDEDTPFAAGLQVPYVVTKRAAEGVVDDEISQGLDAVVVNPAFMLGPWDWKPSSGRLLLAVARGATVFAPRGWLSLCDVRDVATGILAARDGGATGRRYLLAGKTMEWIEACRIFADICGVRRPLMRAGPLMQMIAGRVGNVVGRVTGHEPEVNSAAVDLGRLPKNYSSVRAQRELGYYQRPVKETARDAWQWFQEQGIR